MKTLLQFVGYYQIGILVVFLIGTCTLSAQISVEGYVFDEQTKEPIAFANIWLLNSAIGTTTNEEGKFTLFLAEDGELRVSHINYQEKRISIQVRQKTEALRIGLQARVITVEEVVVTSKAKEEIVQSELSSIVDYIPFDSLFLVIDTKSTFKGNHVSLLTESGDPLISTALPKGKSVYQLVQTCNGAIYALSDRYAYLLEVFRHRIDVKDRLPIKVYETYIQPCKTKQDRGLYYLTSAKNGLVNVFKHYDVGSGKITLLGLMGEMKLLKAYEYDIARIKAGEKTSSMMTNSSGMNQYLRGLQADADFLRRIFYKPKYPNFVFTDSSFTYLMDHFNGEILTYQDTLLVDAVKVQYLENHKWEKRMMMDPVTQKIYGVFSRKGDLVLRSINPKSGLSTFSAKLDCGIQHLHSIKVHNNKIYFLEDNLAGKRRLRYQNT